MSDSKADATPEHSLGMYEPAPTSPSDVEGLVERLRARTVRELPRNWREGLKCPECDVLADRPKCLWDMGGGCPRHDPDNYDPSPYVRKPDRDCAEAADTIERLSAQVAGWQPIETAPRDGTWFLACATSPGWGATRIVRFAYPSDRLPIHGEGVMWPSAPTHWQPLPTPPSQEPDDAR